MMHPLWDTHCHLQDARYGGNVVSVLARAEQAGVEGWVCCGTSEADWPEVLALAEAHPGIVPALGLHPWFVAEARPGWASRLEALLRSKRAAVGECGLDFVTPEADREAQLEALRIQWRLAMNLDRPLTLHCRKAFASLAELARREGVPPRGAVVHAWSGGPEQLRELQDLGFSFGFGCSLAHPDNRRSPRCVQAARIDRLHLETDSPDLPPRFLPDWPIDGLNEPSQLPLVLRALAEHRGEDAAALARQLNANAEAVFGPLLD